MNKPNVKKGKLYFLLLIMLGTLFLLPNFYRNKWKAVDPIYYDEWQIRYDRLVIARLVKNRQDGFFSAGGFLGLGDVDKWSYQSTVHAHQYDVYLKNDEFQSYLIYKSNPGFQGALYGTIDIFLNIPGESKLVIFRGITATASALTIGLIFALITIEFGLLAGVFMLIFSAFSIWTVLPASNIFWNFWIFYLPVFLTISLLSEKAQQKNRNNKILYSAICLATTAKILLSGFDLMTTVLIMTTVPVVYYAVLHRWTWKIFLNHFIKISSALIIGTTAGLFIMGMQIASVEGQASNSLSYIVSRIGKHFAGNTEFYADGGIEATRVGMVELISKYMLFPAVNLRLPGPDTQILYWHIILVFFIFTGLLMINNRNQNETDRKPIALLIATWYSILAPLSWIIIFRPHSIIHPHVNSMGWQMPFTLLGFALCGYVISILFKRKLS